jgi:hypothetical protein
MEKKPVCRNILTKLSFLFLLILLFFANRAFAAEIIRFDFQHHEGEGVYTLFRVEVDTDLAKGKVCFFDTEWAGVRIETINRLYDKELWSNLIDIEDYKHSCFEVELYPYAYSDRWFFSPTVKYGSKNFFSYHTFFFEGEISRERLEGTLYEFRDFRPDPKSSYKNVGKYSVSVPGVIVDR